MLTLQALMYIQGNDRTSKPIWNYARGTLTSWKGCQTRLPYPAVGKCAPMQVIKQPEHGKTLTTEEQKLSSFQTNFDYQLVNPRVLGKE